MERAHLLLPRLWSDIVVEGILPAVVDDDERLGPSLRLPPGSGGGEADLLRAVRPVPPRASLSPLVAFTERDADFVVGIPLVAGVDDDCGPRVLLLKLHHLLDRLAYRMADGSDAHTLGMLQRSNDAPFPDASGLVRELEGFIENVHMEPGQVSDALVLSAEFRELGVVPDALVLSGGAEHAGVGSRRLPAARLAADAQNNILPAEELLVMGNPTFRGVERVSWVFPAVAGEMHREQVRDFEARAPHERAGLRNA